MGAESPSPELHLEVTSASKQGETGERQGQGNKTLWALPETSQAACAPFTIPTLACTDFLGGCLRIGQAFWSDYPQDPNQGTFQRLVAWAVCCL